MPAFCEHGTEQPECRDGQRRPARFGDAFGQDLEHDQRQNRHDQRDVQRNDERAGARRGAINERSGQQRRDAREQGQYFDDLVHGCVLP